ncbi:MAG TPA: 4a-hydroxytetrahydrobiopterin dehydratase [Candidatus Acidoferrales bacterium]|jgi:4a-hydroxytetrahydrobiopterin dehydratase|nr:4a-hydroxytetrahydrobiopterin dehydratase [Candidatus Acidoferrales bacterium]
MPIQKMSEKEVAKELAKLPGWSYENGNLHRAFQFADFIEAFGFMARAALAAEAMGHHPDWSNVWNRVTVDLSTHSIGGISRLDFELATKMQAFAGK